MESVNLNNKEIVVLSRNELSNTNGGSVASAEKAGEAAGRYVRKIFDGAVTLGFFYLKYLAA